MTQIDQMRIDQTKIDQFADRLVGILNGGGLTLMISIGHRTGLFDTMAELGPAATGTIAEKAGLNERYVREWLGALVTGGVVEYDADRATYHLPAEGAALLTRAAGADNLAMTMQWIGVLGGAESEVVQAFHHGEGLSYEVYERFHEVMAEESALTVVAGLEENVLPLVPGLAEDLERGIALCDVGCGAGRAVIHLAERFPASRFCGIDFSEEAIGKARAAADAKGLRNARFEVEDAAAWKEPEAWDVVTTFDAVHDQPKPDAVLANIHAALKPGGVYLMQDIKASSHLEGNLDNPLAPFIFTISCMHCMSVALQNGGAGLGAAWGREKALEMLEEAGFQGTVVHELEHDIVNYWYVSRKQAS